MSVLSSKAAHLAGAALCVVLSTPAIAQEESGTEASSSDIVVTARRTEERLQDVPISITVFNQAQVNDRNIVTASDLAIYTPSLTTNNRFGADKSSFVIRGFGALAKTAPTVAVYFADAVALRSNSGTGGSNGAGPGSLFDLQNVQVLKGPQGTLFGRNTTGGAILLVPQKPTDNLEGYVEGTVGNYDLRRVQAVANIPLAETFKVRLGVDRQKRDGYLRNQSGRGPKDFADSNFLAARLSVVAELTPELENYTIATYSDSDINGSTMFHIGACNDGTNPAFPRTGSVALVAPMACDQIARQAARGDGRYDVENFLEGAYAKTTQWQIINTTTWLASDALTVKNIASYGEYRERFVGGIGGEFFILRPGSTSMGQAGQPVPNVVNFPAPGQYSNIQSGFTEELQLQGRTTDGKLQWQAGGYLELSEPMKAGDNGFSMSYLNCSDPLALQCFGVAGLNGLSNVFNKVSHRNIGFYGQGTYQFTDQLAVTAGARYTIDRSEGYGGRLNYQFSATNTLAPSPLPNGSPNPGCIGNPGFVPVNDVNNVAQCRTQTFVSKSDKPTWMIDLEYKPIPDVMAYVKYSRGYRQGGVDPTSFGLETWAPEKVDTYEIGAKASFSGPVRGYFNAAAFYNDFQDQQLIITLIGAPGTGISGTQAVFNAGKSRIWGLEFDGSVTLFDSLKLDAGYSYLNSKLQEVNVPSNPSTLYRPIEPARLPPVGSDLPLTPHHRFTATATYTLPLDESIGELSIGATYVHTSSQLAGLLVSPYNEMPSSDLVNLNVNWNSVAGAPVDLAFFVTNLTKEKFPTAVAGNWGNGYESFLYTPPRMYGLRLRYRFGD